MRDQKLREDAEAHNRTRKREKELQKELDDLQAKLEKEEEPAMSQRRKAADTLAAAHARINERKTAALLPIKPKAVPKKKHVLPQPKSSLARIKENDSPSNERPDSLVRPRAPIKEERKEAWANLTDEDWQKIAGVWSVDAGQQSGRYWTPQHMYADIDIPNDIFEALSNSSEIELSDDAATRCDEVEIFFNYGKVKTRLISLDEGQVTGYLRRENSIDALVEDLQRQFPFLRQSSEESEGWRVKLFAFVEDLSPEHPLGTRQKKRNIKRIVTIWVGAAMNPNVPTMLSDEGVEGFRGLPVDMALRQAQATNYLCQGATANRNHAPLALRSDEAWMGPHGAAST